MLKQRKKEDEQREKKAELERKKREEEAEAHFKQMEEDLGIILFERHNRKVELTIAGKYLQKELSNNFRRLDDIVSHAKLLNDGIDGNLKFGYVGSAMQKIIPELLLEFRKKHPNEYIDCSYA